MIRRISAFAGAALAALVIAWLLHRRHADPAAEREAGGRRDAGLTGVRGTRDEAGATNQDPVAGTGSAKKRRGLWLLTADPKGPGAGASPGGNPDPVIGHGGPGEPDPSAPQPPEHPWLEYIRKRDAARATWAEGKLLLILDDAPLSSLPGQIGAASGLVLKLDPALAVSPQGVTLKMGPKVPADLGLKVLTTISGTRATVGTDGFMWLVPENGRAACEPPFAEELARWESGAAELRLKRKGPGGPGVELTALLAESRRVEIISKPLAEAVDILRSTWRVRISSSLWDRHPEDQDEAKEVEVPATADRPGHFPSRTPVTLVRESITLEDALKELLAAEDLVMVADGRRIDVCTKKEFEEGGMFRSAEPEDPDAAAVSVLRLKRIHLDGCPLTAGDIAASAASQTGLSLVLDPFLGSSPSRWEAVDADLTLGETLDALEKGGIRSAIKPQWWPGPRPEGWKGNPEDGWTIWILPDGPWPWAGPAGEK